MSLKLPIISGRQAARAFERIGYRVVRRRVSHIRLRDDQNPKHLPLTIPDHRELKPGLLRQLLRDADVTIEQFLELL